MTHPEDNTTIAEALEGLNVSSLPRLVGAVLMEIGKEWETGRIYLIMEEGWTH